MKNKISVVIATCNSIKTISKCIDSILRQTYTDYQIIYIDCLSLDGTVQEIKKNLRYNDILISEKDSGIYDALNKGVKVATGEWIYVMGSDDELFDSEVFFNINKYLDGKKYDMVYGNIIAIDAVEKRVIKMKEPIIFYKKYGKCPPLFHQAVFMRRDLMLRYGLFSDKYKIHADYHLMSAVFTIKRSCYCDINISNYSQLGYSGRKVSRYLVSVKEQWVINKENNNLSVYLLYLYVRMFFGMLYRNYMLKVWTRIIMHYKKNQ